MVCTGCSEKVSTRSRHVVIRRVRKETSLSGCRGFVHNSYHAVKSGKKLIRVFICLLWQVTAIILEYLCNICGTINLSFLIPNHFSSNKEKTHCIYLSGTLD